MNLSILKLLLYIAVVSTVSGCNFFERLQNLGSLPRLERVNMPAENNNESLELSDTVKNNNSSLWRAGSKDFFKSGKRRDIGDIIRVNVEISDRAKLENESNRQRKTSESLSASKLFGTQRRILDIFSSTGDTEPENLLGLKAANSNLGKGSIDRSEKISFQVAATVNKILPDGNMFVSGRQEIRVNYEVRSIVLQGIVRPEDIDVDNTVDSSKIAELRVSYGGRGHISDVQQPRIGSQLIDILSPF